jgi:hypothetical protein
MITLKPYRKAAVPLMAIQTADPAEIIGLALKETDETGHPVIVWDCIHGAIAANNAAQTMEQVLNKDMEPAIATSNPVEFLRAIEGVDEQTGNKAIIVALGLTEILNDPQSKLATRQALWNLRDVLSQIGALLVMTAPMGWSNPFPDDIAIAIAPLPTKEEHIQTMKNICAAAGVNEPPKKKQDTIGDALLGLNAFAAEQALALSVTKQGVNPESLWKRKRQQISETPGLSVYDGEETFEDLGGLNQAKKLFSSLIKGKRKPGAIVFIDEIEKALSGSSGDSSGVSQSMLGYLLSYMQDQDATGSIFVGPPGAAKSAMAKAIGNEGEMPTVTFDLGGIKGSLVGESESRMRKALAVVTAISGGRPFFVATCNAISVLPPELRRRFTIGTMFFDLPDEEERKTIWNIYIKKYKLNEQKTPSAEGWTGAEIKQCCDLADRLDLSLIEAAKFVVPVAVSAKEKIENLRKEAGGRYLSASDEGVYKYQMTNNKKSRKLDV